MKKNVSSRFRVYALLLFFFATVFLLPACRTGDAKLYLMAGAVPGAMLILLIFPGLLIPLDRPSLCAALPLCGFGIMAAAYASPDEALSHCMRCVASLFLLAAGSVLIRSYRPSLPAAALLAFFGLGILCSPLWIPEIPFSLAEIGTVVLLLAVTSFLAVRLRLPALLTAFGGLLLLLLQKNTGAVAVWGLSAVLLFWAAADSLLWSGISLAGFIAVGSIFFTFSSPAVEKEALSALPRIASLPLIPPESIPESTEGITSDSPFFLLGKQYGLIFLLCAILFLILLLIRCASVARHTRKGFHASLVLGIILHFGLRTFLFLCTAAVPIPVSAGSFPFLTYSAPDLFSHFFLLGLLSGVSARNEADLEEDLRLSMLAR